MSGYTLTWLTCADIKKGDVIRFENSERNYSVLTTPLVGAHLTAVGLGHHDRVGNWKVNARRLPSSRPVELIVRIGGYDEV